MEIIKVGLEFKGELSKRTSTDFEIVHHAKSKSCTIYDIHNWHLARGWKGCAYNLFIDKQGKIYEGRPEWASDADAVGYNHNSLSICLEGDFTLERLRNPQRESLINVMIKNRKKYPNIKSSRHKDVAKTNCPGDIDWITILSDVENRIREEKANDEHYVTKQQLESELEQIKKEQREIKKILSEKLNIRIR